MNGSLLLVCCLVCCVLSAEGLSCFPGGKKCTPERTAELNCTHGVTLGPCLDCECAKGLLEDCGGPWDISGTCAENLTCKRNEDHIQANGKCVEKDEKEKKDKEWKIVGHIDE
ncbi:venom protein 302-like [Penaeus japonicus]|uniref:venom protein 302-like n=1 Tax=Penaeus japonicus TaxID=27405 RepID=UPI001C70E77A|nr:venom protein 302-like [Penaeus japonicus]